MKIAALALAVVAALGVGTAARAATLDTVNWAADSTIDGTGSGTLAGGTIAVTYTTLAGVGNAGITIANNWTTSLATDGVAGGGVTNMTAGVLGYSLAFTSVSLQTISFSSNVTDPILLINFTDAHSVMAFPALSLTILDSNHAQYGAPVMTFPGSTNSFDDGFAARVTGTFGPGNPLEFHYESTASFDSAAFTVGLAPAAAVPLPSSALAGGVGLMMVGVYSLKRRVGAARG